MFIRTKIKYKQTTGTYSVRIGILSEGIRDVEGLFAFDKNFKQLKPNETTTIELEEPAYFLFFQLDKEEKELMYFIFIPYYIGDMRLAGNVIDLKSEKYKQLNQYMYKIIEKEVNVIVNNTLADYHII